MPLIKSLTLLPALCLIILISPLQAEIRAIWVLPWSTNTPAAIDSFLQAAVAAQQTDVFIEVRYRSDAMYQTNKVPNDFPNPEPPSHILKGNGFIPLDHALRQGHKRNIRVHAWFVVFNATPTDETLIRANYIYQNHSDWFTHESSGKRQQNSGQLGYYVDPGVPEVQDHLLNVIGDLLSGYPELDGLHLDYVRYPGSSFGHHPVSLQRFRADGNYSELTWNNWRVKQVTDFMERTSALVDSLAPNLVFSAAVIAEYDKAVRNYAQDWQDWLRRGIVDYVFPMAYQSNIGDFQRTLDELKKLDLDHRIVIGIRAWNEQSNSLAPDSQARSYTIMDVAARIEAIRSKGFAGISLFSYDGLAGGNALAQLTQISYPERFIAKMAARKYEPDNPAITYYAADITVASDTRRYDLDFLVPRDGKWIWEVRNLQDIVFYQRSRFYLKGINADYWNGVLDDGSRLPAGTYLISVYREDENFAYVIPVIFGELKG
ncbi:MAG: family 10 glycosylhydrolase [Candidatus Syntrophosphaera sp.]|nr:family 10 glycosylhydrolase [Candidatus Syntrophosphaera sp.]